MKKILFTLFLLLGGMTAAWAQPWPPAVYEVGTLERLKEVISHRMADGKCIADIKLTADIYMSDLGEGESGRHTLCSTFSGTLDGDGHTIWAARPEVTHNSTGHYHRQYLFTYCDGATIKNLTIKNFRIDSRDNHNQAVITSQAKNGCVFENITFDHISTYVGDGHDNTGAAAGYATTNCTFTNITVKNSDFTADGDQSGAVVGHAMNCTFENIKVEHCESTARGEKSGGVAGRTDDCTISNVEILNSFIKTDGELGGGVVGYSASSQLTNCIVDDQSCVCVDGPVSYASAGGIVGDGWKCNISNCINSALIAADGDYAGGIIGYCENTDIVECLNTGMVIAIKMDDVKNGFYNKYKNKSMTYVTKTYQGKEYVIRKYDGEPRSHISFGGIIGVISEIGTPGGKASKCVNLGSVYSGSSQTGGIAGTLIRGEIRDCLSDFSGGENNSGICYIDNNQQATNQSITFKASVNNCLNLTTYKDIFADANNWKGFSGSNNYTLGTPTNTKYTNKTTVDELASGKICHLLGEAWEQNLGTDSYPTPTGDKGVYHTRTVSNEYGTLCLPYALKSDDNISYYTFNASSDDNGEVTLNFDYAETVDPGTPVLFKVAETGDITIYDANNGWADSPVAPESADWKFKGTFEERNFSGNATQTIYYVSNGAIKHSSTKVTIAPYRAYFVGPSIDELTGAGAQSAHVRIVVDGEDGESLALEFVYENHNDNRSYTLFGTEAGDGYRGIVIRGGKKVVINN